MTTYSTRSLAAVNDVGYKVPDGTPYGHWDEGWYTVPANAVTDNAGYHLGLKFSAPDCFDQDFFIKTWRYYEVGTAQLTGAKISMAVVDPRSSFKDALASLDPLSREQADKSISEFRKTHEEFLASAATKNAADPNAIATASAIRTETKLIDPLDWMRSTHSRL
jgi:hypothetical protein